MYMYSYIEGEREREITHILITIINTIHECPVSPRRIITQPDERQINWKVPLKIHWTMPLEVHRDF